MKKIVCFAVGCIALSVAGISPSALAGMEVERFPLTGLPVEPGGTQCGLTATFTSGVLQIMVHVRTDRNGGWHATWREQLEGVNLVDENGQTYRMVGNTHIFTPEVTAENENSGGTSTIHDSWNLLVVPTGGGEADMFHLIGRLQIVITPDGEVKTINERIETECIQQCYLEGAGSLSGLGAPYSNSGTDYRDTYKLSVRYGTQATDSTLKFGSDFGYFVV